VSAVAFLDESGDFGRKLQQGSTAYLAVGLVVFQDGSAAAACRERIAQLRRDLHKQPTFEFHFRDNGHAERLAFLAAVARQAFTYHAVILEKSGPAGPSGEALYLDAVARVCQLAGDTLDRAVLFLDGETRSRPARRQLSSDVRQRVYGSASRPLLAHVEVQDSARNDLVQLADYAAGVAARWAREKRGADDYRALLRTREGTYWSGTV
jgi:hypothetical protein